MRAEVAPTRRLEKPTNTLVGVSGQRKFNDNRLTFNYDNMSRRVQLQRQNQINTNYTYDNLNRLLSVLHKLSDNTTSIDGATYTFDNAWNRKTKVDQRTGMQSNYTYDNIYQLNQVTQGTSATPIIESYTYDLVGN